MSEPDDLPQNKKAAVLITALLISEAVAVSGVILEDDRPHKKKTWLEKQQARRGWREKA